MSDTIIFIPEFLIEQLICCDNYNVYSLFQINYEK